MKLFMFALLTYCQNDAAFLRAFALLAEKLRSPMRKRGNNSLMEP